ncbi:uncharacterized protein TNCV_3598321 [Trichonephila clavipes]|nr:uncharacterized protein TNCV_3598321 [Trichonephila clavipes]
MSKLKELSEFDRGSIMGYHLCEKSVREITDILQQPKSTVSEVIVKNSKVLQELVLSAGLSVERELKHLGFHGRAAAHKPNMTPQNAKHRLQWCRAQRHWTVDMWKTFLWTDESRFTVWQSDGRVWIWWIPGERFFSGCIVPTVKFGARINSRRSKIVDQSRRVLLSSDLHSISVLMAQMETDPPDITNSCEERNRLSLENEALDIVINRCTELVNFPHTDDNHEMKAILRASIDDTQRKKDTMDSVEDFVFPKKTARPVSPLPSKPVTVNNSFSDLESENDKDQVAPEENNETAPPKPKPSPQFI